MASPRNSTPRLPYTRALPYVALAILAAAAAQPLANEWLPCTDDAPFHLYRAVELGSQLALGHWFPRWAPHMALGYGYPFFNFYAPLSSYGVVLLHVFGLAYPAALKLAFALGLWLAGVGALLLARAIVPDLSPAAARSGEAAGLAAGAAYMFAPYLAYDVLFRGNLAESFAFVWPPLVLWGIVRLAREPAQALAPEAGPGLRRQRWDLRGLVAGVIPIALFYAALILTHNIFALIASPLFAGFAALVAWQARSWRVLARGLLALAVGIALTAYFWAPALAERDLVHSDRLFVPPIFTWYTNFISPGELLAPPHAEDPALINPSPARSVGLVAVLLSVPALAAALIGLGRGLRPGQTQTVSKTQGVLELPGQDQTLRVSKTLRVLGPGTSPTWFFGVSLVGYGFLTLPASTPVWRLITPLALVQFPWRMLGPAALCAAVLVGLSVAEVTRWLAGRGAARWLSAAPVVGAVALIYFGSLGWWYPRYCPSSPTANVADLVRFEMSSHTIGTTAKGEYIPRTAGGVPADLTLAQAIVRGEEPSRLSLAANATVTAAATRDPLDARYQIVATQPVTATYQQFFYPGWTVSVDGQNVPAGPDADSGLIAFTLPAGAHALRISFGSTPSRTAAVLVSLIALLGVAAAAGAGWFNRPRHAPAPSRSQPDVPITHYSLLLLFALLPIIKLGVIDQVPNPLRRTLFDGTNQAVLAGAQLGEHALSLDFAGGMRLLGFDLSRTQMPADGAFDVAFYMARTAPSNRRYWPAFDIEDSAGLAWQDPSYLPPRWQREPPGTPLWPLDQYAQWARHVSLLPGTPPGTYRLYGKVFDLDSQQIASVLDAAGNAVEPRFALGQIDVGRPAQPFVLQPPKPAYHDFGPLALLGYDLDRAAANAGDTLRLSWFWRSQAATPRDDTAGLSFVGADGTAAYQTRLALVNGLPTSAWQPGDQWRGQALVRLPASLPAGDYTLTVDVSGTPPGSAPLGSVHVTAPERSYQKPPIPMPNGAEFSGVAVLEGYSLTRTTGALSVTLVWRATATPDVSYSAFVHLEGADGHVWAQSDSAPANWSRPTTGWLAGEFVTDLHTLSLPANLPPGTYTLWAGLYDPASGARVPAAGPGAAADQRVALGQASIP